MAMFNRNECVPEDAVLKEIAKKTDWNDHTGAILDAVRWAKRCAKHGDTLYRFIEKRLVLIGAKHIKYGHMTPDLCDERNVLTQAFFGAFREEFGDETADKFHKCF